MPVKKPKFYAVASGRQTGVFTDWDSCHAQVSGYGGSRYKAFPTRAEAEEFIQMNSTAPPPPTSSSYTCSPPPSYEPPSYAFATSSMSSSSSPSSLASTDFVSGVDQQRRSFTSLAADPSNVHGFDRNAGGSVRQRSLDASTWPTRMNNSQTAGNPNNSSCMSSTSGSSSATGNSGYSPKLGPKSKDGSKMPKSRTRPGVELGDPTSAAAFIDEKFSEGCVLMFTDGGASSNPGPSGSGVFIQVPLTGTFQTPAVAEALREYTAVELAVAIPKGLGTNNRAELEAMADAVDCLEYLSCVPARVVLPASSTESKGPSEPLVNLSNRTVHVFTDSKVRGACARSVSHSRDAHNQLGFTWFSVCLPLITPSASFLLAFLLHSLPNIPHCNSLLYPLLAVGARHAQRMEAPGGTPSAQSAACDRDHGRSSSASGSQGRRAHQLGQRPRLSSRQRKGRCTCHGGVTGSSIHEGVT